jgi:hypothetical protein
MECKECKAQITEYRIVGVYDQSLLPPDDLKQGDISTYLYIGGTFLPLGMTRCPKCGNVMFWDLQSDALEALTLDRSERKIYKKKVKTNG